MVALPAYGISYIFGMPELSQFAFKNSDKYT